MVPSDGSEEQIDNRTRRGFLLAAGSATALIAGCVSDDGNNGTDGGNTDQTDDTDDDDQTDDTNNDDQMDNSDDEELVPEDALAFQYNPKPGESFGEFWVDIVEDTDAAAIRVEAESGGYNEFSRQNGTVSADTGVPVQVDLEGDTVTVFAIDDEGASTELTTVAVPTAELTKSAAEQALPDGSLSFNYTEPDGGDFGTLRIDILEDIDADTLIAQPREAPAVFTGRVGSTDSDGSITAGTTLEVAVDPDGDEVVIFGTVDDATGELTRWNGP